MSRQLTLSATVSVMAMLAFAMLGSAAAAPGEDGFLAPLGVNVSACTPASLMELLPSLQPAIQ